MKRTTIKLPDELDARLRFEAARRGVSISELTRDAIGSYLKAGRGRRSLLAVGAGRSGRSDVSERIESLLRKEMGRSRS